MCDEEMKRIKGLGLPGFYTDEVGRYGITVYNRQLDRTLYVCCFADSWDVYDVAVISVGDFDTLESRKCKTSDDARCVLMNFLDKYGKNKIPVIDALPARHGWWIPNVAIHTSHGFADGKMCSECGYTKLCVDWGTSELSESEKHCPHCGARMDEKRGEE